LEKEREENRHPPKRHRVTRGVSGTESTNMELVTPQNANLRTGWKVTTLGHLVRPMRMRPLHPIERPIRLSMSGIRKKRRKISVITRARRQKIDPTLYGATHLTEEVLKADHVFISQTVEVESLGPRDQPASSMSHQPTATEKREMDVGETDSDAFKREKQKDLALLAKLFEGKTEWDGREENFGDSDDGMRPAALEDAHMAQEAPTPSFDEQDAINAEQRQPTPEESDHPEENNKPRQTRLKDLFLAPTPAPTSILAGLELELELDDSIQFDVMPEPVQGTAPANDADDRVKLQNDSAFSYSHKRQFDGFQTSLPYFFPLNPGEQSRGAVKDLFSVARTQGWNDVFLKAPSSDEVRRQWEAEKVALTRDWKQRYRDACKKERKGGHVDGIESAV
ncbi:hypothetical protein FRC17_009787, partial [Serendipita sp. 399]